MLTTTDNISQQLNNPFFNVANDFNLLTTKAKYIREWSSYIGYVSLPQNLNIEPGLYSDLLNNNNPYDALLQQASLKTFYTDNYLSLRKKKSKWGAQYKIGFNIQKQEMISNLNIEESGIKVPAADTFHNNLDWLRYRIYDENNWSYETDKFRVAFSLPLNYTRIDYKDDSLKVKSGKESIFINPTIALMVQIDPKWSINTSSSYNRNFGDISNVIGGYILETYRNFSNNEAPLAQTSTYNLSTSITFRNPLKIIFFNTGILYSRNFSDLLYNEEFTGSLETLKAVLQNNYKNQVQLFGRFSKYIIDLKTSFGINYNISSGSSQQIQQGELVKFKNNIYQLGATLTVKWSSKLTSEYTANYTRYLSRSQFQQNPYTATLFNQHLSLNYYPANHWIIGATTEHYYLDNISSSALNYYFADITARYTPGKSKIDYELSLRNILGTKKYTTFSLSNNVETNAEYQIRPREILFKMSFPF